MLFGAYWDGLVSQTAEVGWGMLASCMHRVLLLALYMVRMCWILTVLLCPQFASRRIILWCYLCVYYVQMSWAFSLYFLFLNYFSKTGTQNQHSLGCMSLLCPLYLGQRATDAVYCCGGIAHTYIQTVAVGSPMWNVAPVTCMLLDTACMFIKSCMSHACNLKVKGHVCHSHVT